MAKMYFYYGVMGSSKTAQALMTKFNYEEKGKKVFLFKPSTDTRDGTDVVKSRIGLSAKACVVSPSDSIKEYVLNSLFGDNSDGFTTAIVIVDEAQFLKAKQVDELRELVDLYDITVICYGLRTDFQTHLFEGSKRLLELADTITEIKSMCACGKKATVSARIDFNGRTITEGEQIDIGGNEKYVGMCHKCYMEGVGPVGKV